MQRLGLRLRGPLRRQCPQVPHVWTHATGLCVVYSRIPLSRARDVVPVHALEDVFAVATDAH